MESAGLTPPFAMRTRRQVAEEKRKAVEEIQLAKEAKKRKEMYEPRENEDVKPQDIILDPKLLKIYVGHVETEKEVKVEVVLEDSEDEEVNLEGCDGGVHQVLYQEGEEIEEEELDAGNQQEDVRYEEKGIQVEEKGIQVDEKGIQVEEKGIQVEEKGIQVEEKGVQTEDMDRRTEEMSVQTEEQAVEEKHKNVEEHLTLDKVFSNVLPLLNQKDVFRCRLVNKQWRQKVDEFLEDSLVPQHYDDEAYLKKVRNSPGLLCPLPKFRIVKYAYRFKSEKTLDSFNEHMETHMDSRLNPFVGGATVTLENLFIASSHLSRATRQFLEKFGVHIHRLVIEQGGLNIDFDYIGFVDCVKNCLHYVPNLEKLKIIGSRLTSSENFYSTDLRLQLYRNEMLSRTPKLHKLETLEFESLHLLVYDQTDRRYDPFPYFPYLEGIFGDIMIKPYYQSQLKNLSLHWPNNVLNFKLPNVKELSLHQLQCKLSELKVHAPVEKLTLSQTSYDEINLVGILERFPHLRYLSVDTVDMINCLVESNLSQNNVHTLEIMNTDIRDYIPENVQLVFPKLRFLILRIQTQAINFRIDSLLDEKYDNEIRHGRVKIAHLICGGTSYDSYIWTLLPQLEIFTFQFQNHDDNYRRYVPSYDSQSDCEYLKGTKEECPFKSIVETRLGYQRYQERVSSLTAKCFIAESTNCHDMNKKLSVSGIKSSPSQTGHSKMLASQTKCKESIDPHRLRLVLLFLNRKDIFQCRLVNKQWRELVDDFIENSIVPQQYDDKAYLKKVARYPNQVCPLPKFRNVEYAYHFKRERILKLFNERMTSSSMDSELSPFVGRATVTLDNLFVASPAPLLGPPLKEFLEKFGVHIRNLVIKQTEYKDGFGVVRFVECVKLCLRHVPALNRLKIIGYSPVIKEQNEIDRIQWEIYSNELLSRVPKLNNLNTLEVDFSYNNKKEIHKIAYMEEIFLGIMTKPFYQTQLGNLQIDGNLTEKLALKMCNLKELTLQLSTFQSKKILQGKWLEAQVEKLNLIIYDVGPNVDTCKKLEIFTILRVFPLVRYLKLENNNIRMWSSSFPYTTSLLYCEPICHGTRTEISLKRIASSQFELICL